MMIKNFFETLMVLAIAMCFVVLGIHLLNHGSSSAFEFAMISFFIAGLITFQAYKLFEDNPQS